MAVPSLFTGLKWILFSRMLLKVDKKTQPGILGGFCPRWDTEPISGHAADHDRVAVALRTVISGHGLDKVKPGSFSWVTRFA
jgi:hypothetical protein